MQGDPAGKQIIQKRVMEENPVTNGDSSERSSSTSDVVYADAFSVINRQ